MSKVTILDDKQIASIFNLPMAVEAVENAYKQKEQGDASVWPMVFHDFKPLPSDLDIKSGDLSAEDCYGLKVVSFNGNNSAKGLPALFSTALLFDLHTGEPTALLNAGPLTALRTGAAGAIGAKYLARADSRVLVMNSAGNLSPYLIAATLYLMPQIEEVYIVNIYNGSFAIANEARIKAKVAELLKACGCERSCPITASEDAEGCIRKADIILTATPSYKPLLKADWVKPGTHLSCIGSDMEGKQEIESAILKNARVFGDETSQNLSVGECEIPFKEGVITGLTGEIGEVITGRKPGRTSADDITVFDSTGIALQDLASAAAVLKAAKVQGMGMEVTL